MSGKPIYTVPVYISALIWQGNR